MPIKKLNKYAIKLLAIYKGRTVLAEPNGKKKDGFDIYTRYPNYKSNKKKKRITITGLCTDKDGNPFLYGSFIFIGNIKGNDVYLSYQLTVKEFTRLLK